MLTQKELKLEVDHLLKEVKKYFKKAGAKGAIVGNSGGKDSAAVIAIMAKALGAENVLTVTMPCTSLPQDREDALLVAKTFGVSCCNVNLDKTYLAFKEAIEEEAIDTLEGEPSINTKPRLRMATVYAIAQTKGYLVAGTGNRCEIAVGYFTKHGDGGHDYNPIAEFTVEEVYQIARYLGVPEKILQKAPADGLGKLTDEEKLGFRYDQVAQYLVTGKTDISVMDRIVTKIKASLHKRQMPAVYHRITKVTY